MGMFRGTGNSAMDKTKMGVGSIVNGYTSGRWLIVADGGQSINLLSLSTFALSGKATVVEDIHHISSDEMYSVLDTMKLNMAFSDYDFDPKGMKP